MNSNFSILFIRFFVDKKTKINEVEKFSLIRLRKRFIWYEYWIRRQLIANTYDFHTETSLPVFDKTRMIISKKGCHNGCAFSTLLLLFMTLIRVSLFSSNIFSCAFHLPQRWKSRSWSVFSVLSVSLYVFMVKRLGKGERVCLCEKEYICHQEKNERKSK